MPGKKHGKGNVLEPVVGPDSVWVEESEIHYGDTIHVGCSTDDPTPIVLVTVQAETGGQAAYLPLYGDFYDNSVQLGPTPTWDGGGGQGNVTLLSWRDYGPQGIDLAEYITLAGPVPFTVLP